MVFRAFIAVEIGEFGKLAEFSDAVKKTDAPLKMVDLRHIHVTLKFLGDTDEKLIPEIEKIIKEASAGIKPFSVKLKGAGAFPNLDRITVVWAGMEGADQLGIVSGKLDECLARFGFEPENRKFSPHITIARVKGGRNKEKLKQAILDYKDVEFGEQPVDKIKLKKSVLTPQGPVYSDVAVIKL